MATAVTDPLAQLAAYLRGLTADQLEHVKLVLGTENLTLVERAMAVHDDLGWRASPLAMAIHLGVMRDMPHTRLLSQRFVAAMNGESTRQIWNLPARYGKSLMASRIGPVWAFDRDPTLKLALTSYGDSLAGENSMAVRDLLVHHEDLLRAQLRSDRRARGRFVTQEGGGLVAAGAGGSLTGFGANGIVIDDPHKDWKEAHSEAQRVGIWNWYRSVVRTRLEEREDRPGWIIVVMTRWHEDDLCGRLLADAEDTGEDWELVRLPAIAEDDHDLLGRHKGEPLAPDLFTLDQVLARARSLGSYLTAGMEQQRPAPEEGTDIMRGWWRWYDAAPPRYDDALTSWDMKMKDKEAGDFVVGQAWGRTGSDYWCIDQLRGQWNFTTTKTAIILMSVRYPYMTRHVIENTGNGPEVMAALREPQPNYVVSEDVRSQLGITDLELPRVNDAFRRGLTGLLPENPKGDKRARMRAQTGLIEAGNVHLPNLAWAEALVDEASIFPNGTHDDQVDALSQALKRLRGGSGQLTPQQPSQLTIAKPKPGARARTSIARPRARYG